MNFYGWLAEIGDCAPREAFNLALMVNNIRFLLDVKREDLARNKINNGQHGFRWRLPAEFVDGKPHQLELIDAKTGQLLKQVTTSWMYNRKFTCFDEFSGRVNAQPDDLCPL